MSRDTVRFVLLVGAVVLLLAGDIYQVAVTNPKLSDQTEALAKATARIDAFAVNLRNGLVRSCEKNGNPLRSVVRGLLRDQIQQSKTIPPSFFPSIPLDQFRKLIHDQIVKERHRIAQAPRVDCKALYPH